MEANRSYASAAEGSCRVRCHKRLIFCDFRNTFDVKHRYRKPFAPWAAGQWLVKRVLGRLGTLDPLPRPLRVLLVDRCQLPTHDTYAQGMNAGGYASNGTENIHNIDELLHLCAKQRGLQSMGCSALRSTLARSVWPPACVPCVRRECSSARTALGSREASSCPEGPPLLRFASLSDHPPAPGRATLLLRVRRAVAEGRALARGPCTTATTAL